ncbi:hypothetical protein GO495_07875 [Chitinophaga oryziterrae]|uniref:Uncharacterized protein n=1 Tax=Chitinophaga oryziterrae TaxID=1031224 RepID=A0A6N8J5J0_9BACT|nr:hypothetical protein [Chitinophaga oryziterrae]MVT40497.1 hypothetical protein [Chitinophaga oryziterrae]
MDKRIIQTINSCNGDLFSEAFADKTFNGWFLMKTSQVSTRGVSILSKTMHHKKQFGCYKVAVEFFSLQTGYPVWGFCFDLKPSKYMFMKNMLMTRNENIMHTTLLT